MDVVVRFFRLLGRRATPQETQYIEGLLIAASEDEEAMFAAVRKVMNKMVRTLVYT